MIKVFIICKNDYFFKIMQPTFSTFGIEIAGICKMPKDSKEALLCYCEKLADLVIIDANWSNEASHFSCVDACIDFLNYDSVIKIVFISTFFEERLVTKAKQLLAKGYIYRNTSSIDTIINCIKSVAAGNCYYIDPASL